MRKVQRQLPVFVVVVFIHILFWGNSSLNLPVDSASGMHQNSTSTDDDDVVTVFSPSKHNSTVAVCLLIKNETIYLDEWMDFHISLGFGPIYIYDNSFAEDYDLQFWYRRRKDIQKYVKIIHFPQAPAQKAAYAQCLAHDAANETYAALIDVDEFVILKKHQNIVDFMGEHCNEECGQISLNWKMMSISNETGYRPIPLLKRNLHSGNIWGTIKVIVRPSYVNIPHMDWSHSVRLKKGNWVDTSGKIIERPNNWEKQANSGGPDDVALLYHYRFRSEQEFYYKNCIRGDVLQSRGVTPKCTRASAVQGMYGGDYDVYAWEQLKRMVPKYAVFDVDGNATMKTLYHYFPYNI
jgi:hypothetical protein